MIKTLSIEENNRYLTFSELVMTCCRRSIVQKGQTPADFMPHPALFPGALCAMPDSFRELLML